MTTELENDKNVCKRIFVGGLFPEVSEDEIKGLFKSFGSISTVDIIRRKNDATKSEVLKTFAYVNISGLERNIKKCISVYSKTKWKGHELKLQIAKESYLSRLRREKEASTIKENKMLNETEKNYQEITDKVAKTKAAVPGTEIADEKNWVVGKYGRALPVVYIRERGIGKVRKFDPSKHCHQLKKLKDDDGVEELKPAENLTWFIEEKNKTGDTDSTKENRLGKKKLKRKFVNESCSDEEISGRNESTKSIKTVCNSDSDEDLDNVKKLKTDDCEQNTKSKSLSISKLGNEVIVSESKAKDWIESEKSVSDSKRKHSEKSESLNLEIKGKRERNSSSKHAESKKKDCKKLRNVDSDSGGITCEKSKSLDLDNSEKHREKSKNRDSGSKAVDEKISKKSRTLDDDDILLKTDEGKGIRMRKFESESSEVSSSSEENSEECDSDDNDGDEVQTLRLSFIPEITGSKFGGAKTFLGNENNDNNDILDFGKTNCSVETIYFPSNISNLNESWESFKKGEPEVKRDKAWSDAGLGESIISQIAKLRKNEVVTESNALNSASKSVKKDDNMSGIDIKNANESKATTEKCVKKRECLESSGFNASRIVNNAEDVGKDSGLDETGEETSSSSSSSSSSDSDSSEDSSCSSSESEDVKITSNKGKLVRDVSKDNDTKGSPEKSAANKPSSLMKKNSKKNVVHKEFSEEKRLKSLSEREEKEKERRNLVKNALRNVDSKIADQQKHMKFDSSDEENFLSSEDEEKEKKRDSFEKVTGNAAVSWLGLGSSDESDEEKEDEIDFSLKPHFEGEQGQRLFKLQKKMGLDTRFKIDERFLESENEAVENVNDAHVGRDSDDNDDGDDDVNSYDIKAEKENALSILETILGKKSSTLAKEPKNTEIMPQNLVRYDPLREDHAIYEVKDDSKETRIDENAQEKTIKETEEPKQPKEASEDNENEKPVVSNDRFFDVTGSIKDLFNNKESSTFSFLGTAEEDVTQSAKSDEKSVEISAKVSKFHKILDADHQESMDFEESKSDMNKEDISISHRFFFTKDDPRLQSNAIDGPAAFMRVDSFDEISKNWEEKKQELREDFKKKHKDALRRRKKLTEKRTVIVK